MLEGEEGRFANRPYGDGGGEQRNRGEGDGSPHPRGQRRGKFGAGVELNARGRASTRMTCGEGKGRFANRPYGGLAERLNVTGDHKGRPYGRIGTERHDVGGGGGRAVREPPLRGRGTGDHNVPASARTTGGGAGPYGGGLAERLNVTGDHNRRGKRGNGGWVPASARTTEGKVWWVG